MLTFLSPNVHNAFFALCKGHSSSKDQFHKGEELPLTHRIPHTPGSQGHHNLVCFPSQIAASGTAASAPASGLFTLHNHIGEAEDWEAKEEVSSCKKQQNKRQTGFSIWLKWGLYVVYIL